ncbi:Apolipoprotein B-100 [Dissostichus eleginoides]|uniref:Apolipoprotein B-100 n=2 Tax=cellular organisms TaxID=131567 RepID=A0AAD9ERJ2_DISEL|nr:Apolipoprotein B-100 [Dissostichus eleginoides]
MESDNVKLTIPAPTRPTKLIKMTNTLVAVTGSEVKTIPPMVMDKVDVSECTPFFAGMKYCTDLQYTDAFSHETAPFFPITGDSKFAVELHPTGEVTEYTATIAYELLREGEEGRQKVDSVKFVLRAEGAEPTEARAIMKYNRRKNVITADIQIPDYDVEAGLRLGVDGNTKGKGTHSISLDLINKNIPQLSLVGRANLKEMKEAMLQVQLLVPSINADATFTANMKRDEELELELKSEIKVMAATSEQNIAMKYDASKFEVEFKSDVNTETTSLPIADMVDMYGNQLLDIQVGQTEMKVRQIFNKFAEETNNYMEKHGDEFHYIKDFRVPDMPEISLPETLFLKTEGKAVYHFNNEHFSIAIPLPLGGKSTEELNFPPALTTPSVSLPQFGLEIVSMEIPIPELVVPESLTLSIPLFGKAEISTLMKSNLYEMEASMAAGKDIVDTPSYSAKFDVRGTSPVDILSFTMTGSGVLATTDSIKAHLESSLAHKFLEATVVITEEATFTDKLNLKSSSKIEAKSPLGVHFILGHDGTTGMNAEEISAHSDFKGDFTAGPVYGKTISTQSFAIFPFRQEAKIDSTVQLDSTLVKAQNTIAATLANGELSVASNTNAFEDHLTHVAELSFKDSKLSLKSDANAVVLGMKIHNQAEASAGAGEVVMRMETNADHTENRVYSLLTASLDVNGLAVNSDATIKLLENEATHKATLKMNKDGLTTSGTNTLQSPLSLENTFNAGLDASTATLSIANKAAIRDIKVDNANTLTITLSSLDFNSKAEATASEYASYTHDITINLKPYTASANVNNNLNVLAANFINEAQLQAELYKMDLTGNLKAIYGEEEIKLTYQVNYADMTANAKCSTIGKLFGTHMSHNTELEVVGLAARITNDARFNSQPFRFDHTIRCSIVPFDFNLDAIFNADGDMTMYGKHSAQLYGKFLLKAQPLAFASSHECRASVNQQLDNGFALETTLDNKMDTVLSPQEQKTSFRMKSKLNEHAFNQDMSVYNTAERTGIEVSGTFLTNMFNAESTENQEFTISSFLKYDKITECQIILFPLIETLPAFLESVKVVVVRVAEALQDYINNEEIKAKLEALPQYDVEASLTNLKVTVENLLADLSVYIHHFAEDPGTADAINEEYDIQAMVLHVIDTMRELIQQIDLEKLTGSSISFLQDLDSKYDVKAKLQTIMSDVKQIIETFDLQKCVVELKDYISSIEFKAYIDGLVSRIPTEIFNEIVFSVKEIIQDLDILGKINNFYAKMRELIVKFEVDKKVQAVLEKAVEFIHQLKIEETISAVVNKVKDADIPTKLVQVFQDAINYLKTLRGLMESLREIKVAEMIKSVKDVIDKFVLDIVKPLAEFIKEEITNLNVNAAITTYLDFVSKYYTRAITKVTELLTSMVEMIKNMAPEQKIINEIQQIVEGLIVELKKAELNILSFTLPLTDLVVPSVMLSMDKLGQFEIPTQLDIPEFTILGLYTIQATTISFEDIKQRIIELIEFIGNFEIKMIDVDAFFGDLTMNYLPSMPEMSFPEISLPEISFPTIPQVPVEKLVKSLQVPEITLPTIPTQIMVPCFGKLYGEIKFETPIYTVKTSAEFQNSTETQVQGKTTIKVITTPYTADFMNTAFIAMEEGMSASVDTTYNHVVDLPIVRVRSEATVTQKAVARQVGYTLTLTVDNSGTGKINADDVNHKSNLQLTINPSTVTLTFSGDTDSTILKMKQQINAESGTLSFFKFNVRNEAEAPIIKNSLMVASGHVNLYDLKAELKANHDTELYGEISGVLSNGINIVVRPVELIFDFQNKGNAKVNIFESLIAKIDLQNDYSATLKPNSQKINTVALARLNQYKISYNYTVDNNPHDAGIFVAMESEANLDFLSSPISIPEFDLPFVDFRTPEITGLNVYEQTGLNNILTTTEQTVDVDAKIVYHKSEAAPLVDMMGLIQIPSVGNLITELSVKSAILNLNVNAGLYAEEDLVFRLGATTASVFEGLKAKLDGTTSLTTRRGIKLANSLSLENSHIEGTHDSTISMSTETFETVVSVSTVAKIALPILNLEANQNVVADTKTNANAVSTFRMTGDFNLPLIKAVGKAEVDHSLKLEGSFLEVSMESTNKANMDGTVLEDYILLGLLDNDFNLYLNNDGLRSTSKIIADAKLNQGTNKVIEMDVNENLAVEASLSRVYAVLKYTGNNEANLLSFSTNGKHVVQATIDLAPASSLTADIEIDMSQPNTLGDLTIFGKTVAEVTAAKQKISTNGKFVSPLYTTNVAAEVEGDGPVFKVTLKSSATSVIVLLDYDMDGSITVNFENEALNMVSKVVLTHADMNMDVNHAITQALRRKRQADDSNSHHTLNVDITSPTFIDANLRYAAGKDGISASVSTPSSGFMGIQFNGRVPSQMSARVYGRYPSAPEDDVEVLVIRSSSMDADKMNLQIAYNMEAPKVVLSELKTRIPSIISAFTMFADKYQITSYMDELRNSVVNRISEAYEAAINYDSQMSQLSIFFRNIIVQYQKTVQVFIDAVVKVLRETQFKLPESDEMTTLPEVLKKLTSSIATMLDSTLQIIYENIEVSFNAFVEQISSVKMRMPVGDAITGGQILDQVKTTFKTIFAELVDFVKHMESVDTMLEKIGETLKAIVEKSQEFADSVKSDYLDAVFIYINVPYVNFVTALKNVVDHISALNIEQLNHSVEYIIDMFVHVVDQFNNTVNGFLQQASADAQANGPKATCKVSIEVPQTCSFIVRTTGCSLSEVVDMDTEGNPVFAPAASSDAFAAEMERYPLKVVVEGVYDVKLYPEEGETTTILNIKRGIISALAVPLLEEDKNKNMPTIHGKCKTQSTVNAREDIATDISLNRDLSRCDKFVPLRDHTSPLALISGMHYPLAQLVRSSQACNYKFDNENKHMTSGSCIENHILIPFSHNGEHGITNVGKQELTLVQVSPSNEIVFDHSGIVKGLHMDAVEDKSAIQDKDAGLNLLRELASLPETDGEKRAHLFHVLVSMVRGMKTETLSPAIPEALEVSSALTYQVDAGVFAMGLVSNPSALLINDMLEMAKYKPSKPIMYALSNVVKRFYKAEGKLIPEIFAVAEFMGSQLGDCSGDKDHTFMTLRVIGNMAAAMGAAGPALRSAVIQCVNQPAASLAVQQAAIQAFRLTPVPEEGREILMQVLLDGASPMQKRIAAYLVLMKDPQPTELAQLADALPNEQDQQVKSFVISHVTNILSSTEPATKELRQKILDALQGNEVGAPMDPTKFSRNYKIGSVEGNMFFEGSSYLPKEVMLEMTLKAFGYDIDMMEVGMEGNGFEPTVEALFGKNGFFPDTALETMYFVSENMPLRVNEILQNMLPALKKDRKKRQASQNLMREIGRNLNKLVNEMKTAQSPEAMVYLRLLGNELGYLKTNEMEELAYSAAMMVDSMFKMFPTDIMKALMTKADNTIFAHYIFMDNEFFLPTATGVPLRITMSGTFTPGIKGGLQIARDMSEVTFMPSAGIEFWLSAKISMESDNVKLIIPAPTRPTKLIKMTNTLVAVTGSEVKTIPPMVMDKVDVSECTPFFAGMKYCTDLQYTDAFSHETAPFFPITGDSKFAVELHPTGEVTEYTATIAYELLREGEEGRQKVDSVKFVLRAEGAEPTEARAIMKYNRRKNVITADIQIPDYDVEAGLRMGVVDGNTKGKGTHSISLDLINKNIPQLSLVGRANLKEMKEAMLQVQLLVPSINADATFTANMKRDEELELELKSEIKVMAATSEQNIAMKYDASKFEVEFKSDVNTETTSLPIADMVDMYGNQLLDIQVGQTEMKVRQIFNKFAEETNNYMEKHGDEFHYIKDFRVPDMPEISLPETLFLKTEGKAVYHFNNEHFSIAIPLPLGGKSTEELNFPPALTTPSVSLPQFGLEIVSMEIPIPELVVPESLTLSIPLFGKAEISTLMKSNLYEMEASMAAGKDIVDTPSYSAKFDVRGTSPVDILSFTMTGSGVLATTDSIKAHLESSLAHKFLEATVVITEEATFTDKLNLKSSSKIEAKSPLGVHFILGHDGTTGMNAEEISAHSDFKGDFTAGPVYGKTISTQSFAIFPFRQEAKIDSTVQLDSTLVKAQNTIAATLANGELSVASNTNAFEDHLTHVAELSFKDSKLSLKSDANAVVLGMKIHNQAEASAGAGEVVMRMETNADHTENRVYSLLTASLDVNEPPVPENTFNAGLDASTATLSIANKAAIRDIKVDNANTLTITLSSLDFNSKAEATASEYASYTHDITINLKPYTASANVNNNLNVLAANFINEAQLQAELYKMDLTGNLKAIYGEEEIKHTYQVNYADMTANAKCSTIGKLFGTHMSHNTELEVVGLAARITNDARFNSQPFRFDHTIRCSIVPFDFNLDAIFNADGDMTMYGKHSAQLYGKFLLKAQPLAFASSHECRASVNQQLDNGFALETTLDNKMDTVLSPQEQKTSFRMKSKLNEHAFNQDMSVYNTAERTGIEVSGTFLTNMFNAESTENQEFTISSFLKYDKITECQIILFPLIETLPAFLESVKVVVVRVAEALQDYINNEEIKAKLEALPQYVSDFVSQLNVEGKVTQMKHYFDDLTQEYVISMEDVEASLTNLKVTVENLLADLSVYIHHFAGMLKDIIVSGNLPETLIQKIQEQLHAINEEYDIQAMVLHVIDTMRELIQQIDLEKLTGSSISFLQDLDSKYDVKAKLQTIMSDEIIQDLDILGKINNFYAKMRELIVKFEVDKKVQAVLEKAVEFIHQLKIEETISAVVNKVKDADIPTKLVQVFQDAINYLKTTQVEDIIQQLNMHIETIVQKLRSLEYNDFVDHANEVIAEYTVYINELIGALEIPQKLEATRDFVNLVLSSFRGFMESLREIKVAEMIKSVKDVIDKFVLDIVKPLAEFIKEEITNLNVNAAITTYLDFVSKYYTRAITKVTELLTSMVEMIKNMAPEQKIINEIQQIVEGLIVELKKAELNILSFTLPLTDLVVPSVMLSMDKLGQFEIPTQLDIPEFTILGLYTIQATTISFEDIKQRIIELIDFIGNFEIKMIDVDAFFGDLTMNYLPSMPEMSFPEISLPEISFPTIPQVPVEKLVKSLQVPDITLLTIPTQIMVPCFETLKFSHVNLGVEHQASVTLYGQSAQAQGKTTIKVITTPYTADFMNTAFIAMEEGMSASVDTTYNHVVDLPIVRVRSEATVTQKAVARQVGYTLTLTVDNSGTGKINADDVNHKSNLQLTINPSTVTITFSGDTDSTILKMKQQITAESGTLSFFKFNVRNEAEAPIIKNSLMVASGHVNLYDLKAELIANHDTELYGEISGVLSNGINLVVRPVELIFDFKNKGNAKVNIFESLIAKIDLQNDYSATLKPNSQKINTVALVRLNQYKISYNYTVDNNPHDAGIFIAIESEANLDFLSSPISIPEFDLPFVDFRTPEITDLNVYEQTGLNKILTTTEQTVDVDAKIVYHKSEAAPLVDMMGLIQIPSVGNLITELSVKSAILNLNVNAGLYPEEDLVFRLGATTASVFEGLKAKLDGTTSLTTRRGIKLANSLSLENSHIEGTHDSTISMSTETFETAVSVSTVAKIALPILNLEANQHLVADTKTNANAVSTFRMTGDFNLPLIKAVGKAEVDQSLKLEGSFEFVSMESSTKANIDSTMLEDNSFLGVLDNDFNVYLNNNGLRSTSKIIADAKLNQATTKVIAMDVNENLAVEASLSRVYAVLKYSGNNEAHLFNFNTNGKHDVNANIDFAPTSSLTADMEIEISQPSSLGMFSIFGKAVTDVTGAKQKIFINGKFVSPLYTTNVAAEVEGSAPVFKVNFRSSATSPVVFLEYDLDSSITINLEHAGVSLTGKAVFTHTDLSMDIQHIISHTSSDSRLTLNADINSPAFTDVNLRYAVRKDGISATISIPSTGFLGLQLHGRTPLQMNSRIYGRYASDPAKDVDFFTIRASAKEANKIM